MNLDLKGKTALVCGSTQGLGLASAIELSLLGANIVLLARNGTKLQEVITQLDNAKGQKHHFFVADFSEIDTLKNAILQILEKKIPIDILINNTGGPAGGTALEANIEAFSNAFSAHLLGNQLLVQAFVPHMKAAGFGRIINIISTSVKIPLAGLGVSNTIRAAVANWAKTLANELGGFGITVNNVLPGFTKTARLESLMNGKAQSLNTSREAIDKANLATIPAGRYGEASEFGAAVAFLCSPAASYINGINLPVDGGRLGNL
jgi:3-oxoacyl-[acyl-carrier protein] reductase